MEKIKIDLKKIEYETFKFNNVDINIKPYLSMLDKVGLAMEYLSTLFNGEDSDISSRYFISEYALILQIVDIISNIDVSDINADFLIYSSLWDEIKKRIVNYESFRYDLNRIILFYQNDKNLELSAGVVLDKLANKASETMDKISSLDSKELKETSENFVNALNQLNDTAPGIVTPIKKTRVKK